MKVTAIRELLFKRYFEIKFKFISSNGVLLISIGCRRYKLAFGLVLQYYDKQLTEESRAIQSEVKPSVTPGSHTFSRASSRLPVFALGFNLLTGLPLLFVISQRDEFGFVLRKC